MKKNVHFIETFTVVHNFYMQNEDIIYLSSYVNDNSQQLQQHRQTKYEKEEMLWDYLEAVDRLCHHSF